MVRNDWVGGSLEKLTPLLYHKSPWVILNDFGGAFAMGAVGGGIWHGIKGARSSPRVSSPIHFLRLEQLQLTWILQGERFVGAISTIKARAPVTGGNFGVWCGMFSTFDCAVKDWRQKEDAWNAIISGFMTGGCLAARSEPTSEFYLFLIQMHMVAGGPKSALGSAIACGVVLGVFEGVGVLLSRVLSEGTRPQLLQCAYCCLLSALHRLFSSCHVNSTGLYPASNKPAIRYGKH